ncbi:hypothetical protein L493_1467 [Bordetella bronchiseptica 99-R-0433]|nr:hypothetical protein L493_1467 [Bordetella bronchiseptica 99-R-0433]
MRRRTGHCVMGIAHDRLLDGLWINGGWRPAPAGRLATRACPRRRSGA